MALEDDILGLLARESGLKGREIASRLSLDKRLVNSTLGRLQVPAACTAGQRLSVVSQVRQVGATSGYADTP